MSFAENSGHREKRTNKLTTGNKQMQNVYTEIMTFQTTPETKVQNFSYQSQHIRVKSAGLAHGRNAAEEIFN